MSGREGREARWQTFSWRSYIDAVSANVQRLYSKGDGRGSLVGCALSSFLPSQEGLGLSIGSARSVGKFDPPRAVGQLKTQTTIDTAHEGPVAHRVYCMDVGIWLSTYFPAANAEKEAHHIGLLLLLELLDILKGTHLDCRRGGKVSAAA